MTFDLREWREWRDGLEERVYQAIRETLPEGAVYDAQARRRMAIALNLIVEADEELKGCASGDTGKAQVWDD